MRTPRKSRHGSSGGKLAQKLVLTGDFNITFDDRDVYDPDGWRDKILCSEAVQAFSDYRKWVEAPNVMWYLSSPEMAKVVMVKDLPVDHILFVPFLGGSHGYN